MLSVVKTQIKIFFSLLKFIGVCCYMLTGYIKGLIAIVVYNLCHEDMTGKRGENVTG